MQLRRSCARDHIPQMVGFLQKKLLAQGVQLFVAIPTVPRETLGEHTKKHLGGYGPGHMTYMHLHARYRGWVRGCAGCVPARSGARQQNTSKKPMLLTPGFCNQAFLTMCLSRRPLDILRFFRFSQENSVRKAWKRLEERLVRNAWHSTAPYIAHAIYSPYRFHY